MANRIADRAQDLKQSDIRRFSAICASMKGINLSQGVCDQPAPDAVKQAAKDAIDADHAIYTNLRGIAELREAIARKMKAFNGIVADPEREIAVNVGTAGSFACVCMATLNPGDEVIVFAPFYSYHIGLIELIGAKARFVNTHPPEWHYSDDELAAAFTDRTRMVLVNTPANPSGKVFTETELKRIAELANQHDAWIVTDEIYEYITHDKPHVSVGRFPEAAPRTITISGGSKTYAVTGWRIGYTVGPEELIDKVACINDLLYICAPAPLQHGITAGMGLPDSYYRDMCEDYRRKRDMMAATLRKIGFNPFVPDGSYYMLADFGKGRYRDATHAAESILETTGVATVPGSAFYPNPADGQTQLRFCYAKKMPELEEACRRLSKLPRASVLR